MKTLYYRQVIYTILTIIPSLAFSQPEVYDLVFSNGRIFDGTGNPEIKGHVAIKDGKMYVLEEKQSFQTSETIDITGLIIAPGFLDVHSHTPESMLDPDNNANECFIRQGVTTVLGGPDGYWSLNNFKTMKDSINKIGGGTNVAGYIGHNGVRNAVLGVDQQRQPSTSELQQMKSDIEEAMQSGAIGLSTGLMYPPGMFSETEEIIELAKVVSKYDGIYDSHIRNPVNEFIASNEELIRIAKDANLPGKMGHLKAVGLGNLGKTKDLVKIVEANQKKGVKLVSDQYPYDGAGGRLTLRTVLIPTGNPLTNLSLRRNPQSDLSKYIGTIEDRKVAKQFTENGINNGFSWIKAVGYSGLRIVASEDYPGLVGKFLIQIAEQRDIDPFDLICDLILGASKPVQVKGGIAEEDVRALLVQPWNMIASDGFLVHEDDPDVGHPRSTGTFPKILGHYVRDEKLLTMEEAIRKITSFPADFVGLRSRGRIADGLAADLAIFDPKTINDKSTYTKPNRFSVGMIHVLVNGKFVLKNEELTDNRPGRFIERER